MKKFLNLFIATALLITSAAAMAEDTGTGSHFVSNLSSAVAIDSITPVPTAEPSAEPSPAVPDSEVAETAEPEAQETPGSEIPETAEPATEATSVPEPTEEAEPVPSVEPSEETLTDGSRGNLVKAIQLRLIETGYMTSEADGLYGSATAGAIKLFQHLNGMEITGEADTALQALILSDSCPVCTDYAALDFEAVSADPDAFSGTAVRFDGRVLQVITDAEVAMRLATRGAYEDVVYVTADSINITAELAEADRVTVFGTLNGSYTYQTASGKTVTLPYIKAEFVVLK